MIKEYVSWIPTITYIVIISEVLALLFGIVIAKNQSIWNTRKNQVLLYSDLVFAWSAFLMLIMGYIGAVILIFSIILLLSHAYRIIEYYLKIGMPFCFNRPLYLVNLAKFAGLAISIYVFI
jgi:hypothetical protein